MMFSDMYILKIPGGGEVRPPPLDPRQHCICRKRVKYPIKNYVYFDFVVCFLIFKTEVNEYIDTGTKCNFFMKRQVNNIFLE